MTNPAPRESSPRESAPRESPPRESVSSQKRQRVLEAATALFMAQGYGAVSMDAVAQAAAVSKATLYAWFASKDRLFATIIGEACLNNSVAEAHFPAAPDDIAAALHALASAVLTFLVQPEALAVHRIVIFESLRFPEMGEAFMENGPRLFRRRLATWLAAQAEAGRLTIPDPAIAADQFSSLLRGELFMRASLGLGTPPADTIDTLVTAAVHMFLSAYGIPPAAADRPFNSIA